LVLLGSLRCCAFILFSCLILASCGTDSEPASATSITAAIISGTATTGSPLAQLPVEISDALGRRETVLTGARGDFSLKATRLASPYLVRLQIPGGRTLYSVSVYNGENSTVNLTPLTDLIVRSWYDLRGLSVDYAFDRPKAPRPTSIEIDLISRLFVGNLSRWLRQNGVPEWDFKPISTVISAETPGIERVLQLLETDSQAGLMVVRNGALTQQVSIERQAQTGRLTTQSQTTGTYGTTTFTAATYIPQSRDQLAGIRDLNALASRFAQVIDTRGESLTADDLAAFMTEDLLHDGLNRTQHSALLATTWRGLHPECRINRILALNIESATIEATLECASDVTTRQSQYLFVRHGADWLIDGSHRQAALATTAETRNYQGAETGESQLVVSATASAPENALAEVKLFSDTESIDALLRKSDRVRIQQAAPTPETELRVAREVFTGSATLPWGQGASLPPLEIILTSTDGHPTTEQVYYRALTTEPIRLVGLPDSALPDAYLDKPLELQWTLPETFDVSTAVLLARTSAGTAAPDGTPDCVISGTVTNAQNGSGNLVIPGTCRGVAVRHAALSVLVIGTTGERSSVQYAFESSPNPRNPVPYLTRAHELLSHQAIIRTPADQGPMLESECNGSDGAAIDQIFPPECKYLSLSHLGGTYHAYLLSKSRKTLTLYIEGHCYCGKKTLAKALCAGADNFVRHVLDFSDVLFLDMPLYGINGDQSFERLGGQALDCDHGLFAATDRIGDSALAYFVSYISTLLDTLAPHYEHINLVGRSGGGWAATIYAALDRRIQKSVSVAGSVPFRYRGPEWDGRDDTGDWEQSGPLSLRMLDYDTLYALSAFGGEGRSHHLYFNEFDFCCFSGAKGELARNAFHEQFGMLSDVSFSVVPGETEHSIPVDRVMADLFGSVN